MEEKFGGAGHWNVVVGESFEVRRRYGGGGSGPQYNPLGLLDQLQLRRGK